MRMALIIARALPHKRDDQPLSALPAFHLFSRAEAGGRPAADLEGAAGLFGARGEVGREEREEMRRREEEEVTGVGLLTGRPARSKCC